MQLRLQAEHQRPRAHLHLARTRPFAVQPFEQNRGAHFLTGSTRMLANFLANLSKYSKESLVYCDLNATLLKIPESVQLQKKIGENPSSMRPKSSKIVLNNFAIQKCCLAPPKCGGDSRFSYKFLWGSLRNMTLWKT